MKISLAVVSSSTHELSSVVHLKIHNLKSLFGLDLVGSSGCTASGPAAWEKI